MGDAKNPTTSHEANVKFLVACFLHMKEGGRPDFAKITEVLELPSTGAAAKRFERMMKNPAFGGVPDWSWTWLSGKTKSDKSDEGENGTSPAKKRKASKPLETTESNDSSKQKRSKKNEIKTEVKTETKQQETSGATDDVSAGKEEDLS